MKMDWAAIKILDCTPQVLQKFPQARSKVCVVETKTLKRGTPGLGYFKPQSQTDFSPIEKYRYVGVNSDNPPLCHVVVLGETSEAVRGYMNKKRPVIPRIRPGDDINSFHTEDEKRGRGKTKTHNNRSRRSDGAVHKRSANFESMSKLMSDASLLLGGADSSETIRPRSSSMDQVKRKTPDSLPDKVSHTPPAQKRSLSNDRIATDRDDIISAVREMKESMDEQILVWKKELEEERALRKKAQEEMEAMRREQRKDRDILSELTNILRRRMALRPAESEDDNDVNISESHAVMLKDKQEREASKEVCLGTVDKKAGIKLYCSEANFRSAVNATKGIDWAKQMLLGIYGNEAKLMRFHAPRSDDPALRKIPDDEYHLIADAYDKWLTKSLGLVKGTPVYTSWVKALGNTIGAAGRSLYTSPVTGNGSKLSSSSRKQQLLSGKSLAPRKSCDKSDSYLSSRTSSPSPPLVSSPPPPRPSPRPSLPSSPLQSPPSSPPPSYKKRNDLSRRGPVTSTQDSHDNANYNWNISSVPGYVDMRHVRQSQALRDIGKEYYPSRGSESDDSGSVSENEVGAKVHDDSDETYYDSQWDKKRESDRETSPDP